MKSRWISFGVLLLAGGCQGPARRGVEPLEIVEAKAIVSATRKQMADAEGLYRQALKYQRGDGVEIDLEKGLALLNQAAETGYRRAMYRLADMYYGGDGGVKRDFDAAFKWFTRLEAEGDVWGMAQVAYCYRYGHGVTRDRAKAKELMAKAQTAAKAAAEKGDVLAMLAYIGILSEQMPSKERNEKILRLLMAAVESPDAEIAAIAASNLVNFYTRFDHLKKEDYENAKPWAEKAAAGGSAQGLCDLALMYHMERSPFYDPAKGVELFRKAEQRGSLLAISAIGVSYYRGIGVQKDVREALAWNKRGAEMGSTMSMYGLHMAYRDGMGVAPDEDVAMDWLRKAATSSPRMRYRLGIAYLDGKIAKRDVARGLELLNDAAEDDVTDAMIRLGDMYSLGDYVAKDYVKARQWYEKAVAWEEYLGYSRLGETYQFSQPPERNFATALEYYRKGAEKEDSNSLRNIGFMYYRGEGVEQDYAEAMKWLRRAADAGHILAMADVGMFYEFGLGIGVNYDAALQWYRKSAAKGGFSAMYALGRMYERGRGVQRDVEEARKWYQKAADLGVTDAQRWLENHPRTTLPGA